MIDGAEIAEIAKALDGERDAFVDDVERILTRRLNVILYGPPGTGKTRAAFAVRDRWSVRNGIDSVIPVTFHPSYNYEDFVRGYRPKVTESGVTYEIEDGVLLQACRRAENAPTLLLIDEINRGDVSRIFGELITYIEEDKRGEKFRLSVQKYPGERCAIPLNLHFLCTMNSADKSISMLDVALRRRFALVEVPPDPGAFARVSAWRAEVAGVDLGALLAALNARLDRAGIEPDRRLGQALLKIDADDADPVAALKERLHYDVYPLITEYFFLERQKVREVLEGLVDESGRFRSHLDSQRFIETVRGLAGESTAAAAAEPDDTAAEPLPEA
ncbi:MAG TPA: AAA family ATPase [Candidatus Cybelea sp.]|jgi:5-methylcytosine-specific restriction protein B|nr:AAA family ATPase [Candidatus Cybelea sp.]